MEKLLKMLPKYARNRGNMHTLAGNDWELIENSAEVCTDRMKMHTSATKVKEIMFNLRYIKKGLSLRIVNLVGLTVTVVSLVLSIGYIRHERSYDRHH